MKRFILLPALLFVFWGTTVAQQWTVYNTINSDIPSNGIRALAIDGSGSKWIGSTSGLGKFDNSSWTNYNNYIYAYFKDGIAFDLNNDAWIAATVSQQTVCRIDDTCYVHWDSISQPFHVYNPHVLAVDSSDNIWLAGGAGNVGKVLQYDGTNWTFHNNTDVNSANCIAIDDDQNIWIGAGGRMCMFDGSVWTMIAIQNSVNDIAIDDNDIKWLATSSGLVKYDGTVTTYNTTNSDVPSNYVRAVTIDLLGNVWVGTDYGVAMFDGTDWTYYTTSNSDIPSNNIGCLATDLDGRIWVGTNDEGLAVFEDTTTTAGPCSAEFDLYPHPSVQHDWYLIPSITGNGPFQYHWNWGDGTTSNLPFPTHTYDDPGYYNICLTIWDSEGCASTYCDSSTYIYKTMEMATVNVVSQAPTGVQEEQVASSFSIYPNPVIDALTLESQNPVDHAWLTDLKGRRLQPLLSDNNNRWNANLSELPPGMYLVDIFTLDGKRGVIKVVRE